MDKRGGPERRWRKKNLGKKSMEGWVCGSVEDDLPNMHKALGLIPGTTEIKRRINLKR